jgi:hypothetical protein
MRDEGPGVRTEYTLEYTPGSAAAAATATLRPHIDTVQMRVSLSNSNTSEAGFVGLRRVEYNRCIFTPTCQRPTIFICMQGTYGLCYHVCVERSVSVGDSKKCGNWFESDRENGVSIQYWPDGVAVD